MIIDVHIRYILIHIDAVDNNIYIIYIIHIDNDIRYIDILIAIEFILFIL